MSALFSKKSPQERIKLLHQLGSNEVIDLSKRIEGLAAENHRISESKNFTQFQDEVAAYVLLLGYLSKLKEKPKAGDKLFLFMAKRDAAKQEADLLKWIEIQDLISNIKVIRSTTTPADPNPAAVSSPKPGRSC